MISLSRLDAQFSGFLRPDSGEQLLFDCPACGPRHRMTVTFSNPLDGKPCAGWKTTVWWEREGDTIDTLTLIKSTDAANGFGASVRYPCWHGWIENGHAIHESEGTQALLFDTKTQQHRPVVLSPRQVEQVRR